MGTAKRVISTLVVLGLLILCSYGEPSAQTSPSQDEASGLNPGLWLVNLYRNHISPIDGDRCPSLPTCSSYSVQAMEKHGFFLGWMMTVDRLLHEGGEETKVSPVVHHEGQWRIFDPVQNNDFWWHRSPAAKGNADERTP